MTEIILMIPEIKSWIKNTYTGLLYFSKKVPRYPESEESAVESTFHKANL